LDAFNRFGPYLLLTKIDVDENRSHKICNFSGYLNFLKHTIIQPSPIPTRCL